MYDRIDPLISDCSRSLQYLVHKGGLTFKTPSKICTGKNDRARPSPGGRTVSSHLLPTKEGLQ